MIDAPYRILIVDDRPEDRAAFRQRLAQGCRRGYAVLEADSGEEGLRLCRAERPDCVLVGEHMPDLDGLSFLGRVQAEQGTEAPPVVLLSGEADQAVAVQALRQGAHDCLVKDRQGEEMCRAVETAIESAILRRRIAAQRRDLELTTTALRSSEERFRLLVDGVRDYAIYMLNPQGLVVSWNAGAERILGYRTEEVLGKHSTVFYNADDVAQGKPEQALAAAAAQGRFEEEGWRVRRDGTSFWADTVLTALHDDAGRLRGYARVMRDVTESRKLEEQVRQTQKMAALGQLAGGVAHNFNNLLTVITGYGDLMLAGLELNDPLRAYAQAIQNASRRAAELTAQLLAFSRKNILQLQALDLNRVAADLQKMLARLLPPDVELIGALDPALRPVRADSSQMSQALLNLALNARDALRGQPGRITVTTANVELSEEQVRSHPDVRPGPFVRIAVRDTGSGMTEQVRAHLFEPFFTTKGLAEGTGLGLASVYATVTQAGGFIEVDSAVGQGSTFALHLPALEGEAAPAPTPAAEPLPRGSEVVLLVEDEEALRGYVSLVLRDRGYTVLEARDGEEAMAVVTQHEGPIDLLLTDVLMPRMGGAELARRLRVGRPQTRVLFMSAHPEEAGRRSWPIGMAAHLLEKPFTPAALARRVREALDAP